MAGKIAIMETVLRDAHQCLVATRMRTEDMLPIAAELDDIGYWSLETWGGATFDATLRFLHEDPWERLRKLRAAMPKTRFQMLLRGQNVVAYRNYPDDVVQAFVARAAANGIDVFRIFDAMNDVRNLTSQVPGGMLSNLVAQLRQQKAEHQLDAVLAEMPHVRRDFGYPPLVTPTSQIVGSQAALNVVTGKRYSVVSWDQAAYRSSWATLLRA